MSLVSLSEFSLHSSEAVRYVRTASYIKRFRKEFSDELTRIGRAKHIEIKKRLAEVQKGIDNIHIFKNGKYIPKVENYKEFAELMLEEEYYQTKDRRDKGRWTEQYYKVLGERAAKVRQREHLFRIQCELEDRFKERKIHTES